MMDIEQAEETLQQLCKTTNSGILWIFRQDIDVEDGELRVLGPLPRNNRARARESLAHAVETGTPIEIFGVCLFEDKLCASFYLANEPVDAEYRRIEGIKYSCPSTLKTARAVRFENRLMRWLKNLLRAKPELPFLEDLPRR